MRMFSALIKIAVAAAVIVIGLNFYVIKSTESQINANYEMPEDTATREQRCAATGGGNVVWNSSSDNYLKGTSTYQTYCLFEYKPSKGYNPNYTLSYFTLPDQGIYNVTYNYVDGAITMPSASGDGMNGYFVLGLSVAGLAVTMFTGYAIYYGKGRKKRRARRRK